MLSAQFSIPSVATTLTYGTRGHLDKPHPSIYIHVCSSSSIQFINMAVVIKASSLHLLDYEPAARFHHSGAVASDGKFYSYGGRFGHIKPGSYKERDELRRRETSSSVVRTTINRFDTATERWHSLPTSGNSPPGRIGVACAVIGTKFYVFGGRSRNRLFSTLSELDLDTMTWKELEPLSPPENTPMAKMGAVMVSFDNRYLIVYGGYGVPAATPPGQVQGVECVSDPGKGVWTNEMHCFDLKTGMYITISHSSHSSILETSGTYRK